MALPSKHNNPHWPLPADYPDLTRAGQRIARVNACTSWFDPERPTQLITDPEAFVVGFHFFKDFYRKQWRGNKAKYTYEDAPWHRRVIELVARNRMMVVTAFRGGGKTMLFGEEFAEFCVATRPNTPGQYTTAAQDLSEKQVRAVKLDLETNEILRDDFGASRKRGYVWRNEYIELANMSSFKAVSAEKRQRGTTQLSQRPIFGILDDWEVDQRVRNPVLRSDAEDYLFDIYLPCFEPGAWFIWPNTLLAKTSWAMKATDHQDERFYNWKSVRFDASYIDDKGQLQSWWPARFPLQNLEAMEKGGKDDVVMLGRATYRKEFMNEPGAKDDAAFAYREEKHTYHWEVDSENKDYLLVDHLTKESIRYRDLVERSICVVGVDLALGRTKRGCFSAVIAARLDDENKLWVLEEWVYQSPPMDTLYKALDICEFWGASVLAIERVTFEQVAIDMLQNEIITRRERGQYAPEIDTVIVAGGERKEIRMLKLAFRFDQDLIKIPLRSSAGLPFDGGTPTLAEQIEGFTPLGGNLAYVDALDALATLQVSLLKVGKVVLSPRNEKTQFDLMREFSQKGMRFWPGSANVDAVAFAKEDAAARHEEATSRGADDLASIATGWMDDDMTGSVFDFGPDDLVGDPYAEEIRENARRVHP